MNTGVKGTMEKFKSFVLKVIPEVFLIPLKRMRYLRSLKSFSEKDVTVIKWLVKSGDLVVDVGANVGWYTKVLSELAGEHGHVWSIEPAPSTFDLLSFCVKKLGLHNVNLVNCAISENNGSVLMEVPKWQSGGENFYQTTIVEAKGRNKTLRSFTIQSKSIDSLFSELSGDITFIKCDVEGHELSVIKGAEKVIEKSKPAWLVELSNDPDDKTSDSYALCVYLEKQGYLTYWFDGKKIVRRSVGDTSINYFFLTEHHLTILNNNSVR